MAEQFKQHLLTDWPGQWEKWATVYCLKNQWRVSHILGGVDDCVAECALVFCECRRRYGATVPSDACFMALYKMFVTSWFNTLSKQDGKQRAFLNSLPANDVPIQSDMDLSVRIRESSEELRSVLRIMLFAPDEMMNVFRSEVKSQKPISFVNRILQHCGLQEKKAQVLTELTTLLS